MPKATSSASKGKRRKRSADEIRQYKAQWYQRNKQRIRESLTEEQRAAKRACDKKYYAANKARICERQKRYNASNSAKLAEQKRQYRSQDPERWRSYYREYAAGKSDERKAYARRYYRQNTQKIKERAREYAKSNASQVREYARAYRKSNAEKIRTYKRHWTRDRTESDHLYRLIRRVGCRVNNAIRSAKARKSACTIELVGCSPAHLAAHIAAKFKPGMGWHNRTKWHIDHVLPLAAFDLANARQQRVAFHYSNLQPLWKHENLSKGARLADGTNARGSRYRAARNRDVGGTPEG
jgi:hypothetical protein